VELRPILLDTNAYTAFKHNVIDAVEIFKNTPLIGLNSIILGELYGGFALGSREERNRSELSQFLEISKINCFSVDSDTAEYYARVYRSLRKKGNPIPTNDMWIAATALQYDLALFSYDKHFQAIDGLRTGNCIADFRIVRSE
jgi:predicted nucleic acid-binding protein